MNQQIPKVIFTNRKKYTKTRKKFLLLTHTLTHGPVTGKPGLKRDALRRDRTRIAILSAPCISHQASGTHLHGA